MKKLIVILTVGVLACSVWAAEKPADTKAVKVAACAGCKKAGGACATCKAKTDAEKAACATDKAGKEAGCTNGVCPLKK